MSAASVHYSYDPCAPCRHWQLGLGKATLIFSLRAVICVVNVKSVRKERKVEGKRESDCKLRHPEA